MPFLGGRRIASQHGEAYADWLTQVYKGTGDTDYVGYFFHRAAELLSPTGCVGFIATAAITDGDNRRTVLARLMQADTPFEIYGATTGVPWQGNAQVRVSTVHLGRGLPPASLDVKVLDDRRVRAINSRLRSGEDWPDPLPLTENEGGALVGCFLRGDGFVLDEEDGLAFLRKHPEEANVVRPFLVGDDLNNSPEQRAQRYVIDFRDMTLDEARRFPHALAIVERDVRPKRERLKTTGADADHRKHWWRFANTRRELRERAATMPRFLAAARVSKHTMFAFVPSSWTPSEQVVIFPLPTGTAFAVLQSRIHRVWVTLQASHMGEGIRYSATDCFTPFPFPARAPIATLPKLEALGEELHASRAAVMAERQEGLTQTYNALHDPECQAAGIVGLRRLHEAIDRSVLDAYGWRDVRVPAYCSWEAGSSEYQVFEDTVAARLFALNVERSAARVDAERNASPGPGGRAAGRAGPGPHKVTTTTSDAPKRLRGRKV
ncbi:MAG TPA: type IIL restriction-modification enzyme MmeI [Polyangiaceae bacterium]|nr:type IIL restriction-modification enzyme MmeI [Polyangiaceae bacterium]